MRESSIARIGELALWHLMRCGEKLCAPAGALKRARCAISVFFSVPGRFGPRRTGEAPLTEVLVSLPEAWLRGPLPGVAPVLQPAAFALVQAREDIARAVEGLSAAQLRAEPGGAASVGFHLRHIARSIDRLLSYSRGQGLTAEQLGALAAESEPVDPGIRVETLARDVEASIDRALVALRAADPTTLHDGRTVGRAALPSTVFGVLFHIAEHTQRHTGQIIATAKVVRVGAEWR